MSCNFIVNLTFEHFQTSYFQCISKYYYSFIIIKMYILLNDIALFSQPDSLLS